MSFDEQSIKMFMDWLHIGFAASLCGDESGYEKLRQMYPEIAQIDDGCEIDDHVINKFLPNPLISYNGKKIYKHIIDVLITNNRYAAKVIDFTGTAYIDGQEIISCYTKLFRHMFCNSVQHFDLIHAIIPNNIECMLDEQNENIYYTIPIRANLLKWLMNEINRFNESITYAIPELQIVKAQYWEDFFFSGDRQNGFYRALKYELL